MTINFNTIPQGVLVPMFWAEITSKSEPYLNPARILLIAPRETTNGVADDDVQYILSDTAVNDLYGQGSAMASMYRHVRMIAPLAEVWGISHKNAGGDVAATGTVSVGALNNLTGKLSFRIGENTIAVSVSKGDTNADVALKIKRRINGNLNCPVTASVASAGTVVTLTAKWKGETGNSIAVRKTWWGHKPDVASVLTIVDMANGVGGSNIDTVLAGLSDAPFDVIALGYKDDATLDAMTDFMDNISGRWSPYQQVYGHVVSANGADFAGLITQGGEYNDPSQSILGIPDGSTPFWCWAAEVAAWIQVRLGNGPPLVSRSLTGLELPGVEPAADQQSWFDITERQSLLEAGIATLKVDQQRHVLIDRIVTTYKTDVDGNSDASWRDVNTRFQIMYFTRFMRQAIQSAFPQAALTDDDLGIEGFASPGQIKDVLIHAYQQLQNLGLVENVDLFAKGLVVERNALDANRVDILMRPDVVNQLDIIAALIQSNLQLTDETFASAAT
jgi:phage tail sheath gpL-like